MFSNWTSNALIDLKLDLILVLKYCVIVSRNVLCSKIQKISRPGRSPKKFQQGFASEPPYTVNRNMTTYSCGIFELQAIY